jgi:uncharacterized protein YggT (Ycf19 family)
MRAVVFLITTIFNVAISILGIRFLLKLFGANPGALFVRWVYETSQPLLHPFAGMFPPAADGRFIFDFNTLFAIAIYALIGYVISELVVYLYQLTHRPVVIKREELVPRHRYSIHSTLI